MGDSDASIKRRVADIEAALDNLRADLGDRSDARDAAVAELVAAMREQTAAIRAAAATAGAEAKPDVPPEFSATPTLMAPACHAAALALQAGPTVDAGTDLRDSWPAAWAQRAVRQHAAWRAAATDIFAGDAGGVKVEGRDAAAAATVAALERAACAAIGARASDPVPPVPATLAADLARIGKADKLRTAVANALRDHAWRLLEAGARPLGWPWHVRAVEEVALAVPHPGIRDALVAAARDDTFAAADTGTDVALWRAVHVHELHVHQLASTLNFK